MKALTWHGRGDIRCETVPDPEIKDGRDAIIRVTSCAICGSDLHLYGGFVPRMESGDILGHECMGEVVEVGRDNKKLKPGDRVIVPFTICCGACRYCQAGQWSLCETTNPNASEQAQSLGYPTAGMFGYSHLTGGYSGGQAEYLRVPFADVGPLKVPAGVPDDQLLFLSDILPTGYMAAENCDIQPGNIIVVFGCGPVGLFAIMSAFLLGAERVIAIDAVPERLALARKLGAETIDDGEEEVQERILQLTRGLGPDAVIEAVGMESHGQQTMMQKAASFVASHTASVERPFALNAAILACRPGTVLSVPGVYMGSVPVAFGALMNKGLILRTGQTHMLRYMKPLLDRIERGELDPSVIITHRLASLDDGPEMYDTFRDKKDGCIKVVMRPHG
ncbi:glutathione-dependent formaldehyde dehydrogenase [Roseomonas terrae]|uniref:Glutathione-dependent formaldehyde dehydrogenase n=1 Tax=Neoroseomonas terrae TaxID=424799 RepID=A0ABS5EG24_9PROT|nr:zinc-dependent alcohol dehydrogenase [Neoroseomonas terrae]MBR0649971.1 glutathione-dependent formaldehyde dehydrogenase [Neoroseomonas terrae]